MYRHSIFDFDKFDINIKSKSDDPKIYVCKFTPINGVHHAASMFASSCTIDMIETSVESCLIQEVTIEFAQNVDEYDVVTTYFAVDVL